ncbi:MAG: NAD(P)-dependent dehydrogenase (short-subunit alcohol dehydrogenase family) [Candidatus Azotimanducaceae bacterium]|jgi:NAD(P)-dependent dehydrogenase (short-subunit alcohol dehydrogenase family)|tara:strand:+ start:118 stop:966 length:849 start_codon:yes stop_codon:yes gene_type:complete
MTQTNELTNNLSHYPELAAKQHHWQHDFRSDALKGKTILVTGAGDGIGSASAKTYASFGANVILLGRTRSKLETVFDWIETHTNTASVIVPCDLENLDSETVENLADSIAENFGQLDGLVHNASRLGPKVPIAHYPADEWQKVMQTNVNAVFMLNKGLFELLDKSANACVIHTSSSVGREARAYWGAYAASKFALEGLNQLFADETETAGNIQVYSVNPGGTRTAMRKEAYPLEDPSTLPTPEDHMELYLALMCTADQVSGDVVTFTTGQQLDARTWLQRTS